MSVYEIGEQTMNILESILQYKDVRFLRSVIEVDIIRKTSAQGAGSPVMFDALNRITTFFSSNTQLVKKASKKASWPVSSDMAHQLHQNYMVYSSKNVNVLREEDVRGVESDLVDSFEEGEIRDDSVLYNDGCIKDCMEKNLEDDTGEILGVHSQGDCGNVTTDDNEDVTPVIGCLKKDSSLRLPPSTPPGR
ncbi:hypothetical protein Tco_0214575 [Tanacetum coccineum]